MKAFAVAAAAVLLLAGSAAAQGCLNDPALGCATCSTTDPNLCATCATGFTGVSTGTGDIVDCFADDACTAGISPVPGCLTCDTTDPRNCATCDTTAGYLQLPNGSGGCDCNTAAGFSLDGGVCVCAAGFVNPVDANTQLPIGECVSVNACTTSSDPAYVAGCQQCNANDPRTCDLCDGNIPPVDNACAGTPPPCTETVPGCATCDANNACATCNTDNLWEGTAVNGSCVCIPHAIPSTVPGAGACVCDEANGWALQDGVCTCSATGFTPVGQDCVANDACLQDPSLNCVAGNTTQCNDVDPRACAACASGFTLLAGVCVANNACLQDPALHCAPSNSSDCSAVDPRRCAACATGFVFDPVTQTCSAGGPTCNDPNCEPGQCPASPDICTLCIDGFVPIDGVCVMDGCVVDHCIECVIDPNTQLPEERCEVCARGYELTEDGKCEAIAPPTPECHVEACLHCMPDKPDLCETCIKGFELDADFNCVPIRPRPGPGRCMRRFPGCLRCDKAARRCLRCAKGRRLVKGRCIKPRKPHHHKRPRKVVCKKGYRMVKGRCVRIAKRG